MDVVSIDFETGSRADLKKSGAARYAEYPSTRVLCMAYQFPGKPVITWREGETFPVALIDWVRDGGGISGWNVLFEFYIWNVVLRRQVHNQPIPKLRVKQLNDTMAVAAYNGLPLGLDTCAKALPHLGIVKDKQGHALMLRMSRPRKVGTGGNPDEWWHLDDPVRFDQLVAYCAQDVRVESAILGTLEPLPQRERQIWLTDVETSIRGMLLDTKLANAIEYIAERETVAMDLSMHVLTVGAVSSTRAVAQLLAYVQKSLPTVKSLAKDQLATLLSKKNLPPHIRAVLELRQEAAKSSVAKVKAMKAFANIADNRMRGLYQYYGAFRTGRDAGRGPQIQNFPRGSVKDVAALVDYILARGDGEGFEIFFGVGPLEGLASALRACITVPDDKVFCSYDFAQIEARVTPWLAGDTAMMDVFRQGRDIYIAAAAGIYRTTEDKVSKAQRQIGKVSTLALGFGGGVGAFQAMAKNYGLEVTDDEAETIKSEWRAANPLVVQFWHDLNAAAIACLKQGTHEYAGCIGFRRVWSAERNAHDLRMVLPSGRHLIYREAEIGTNRFGWDCVTYMGVDQYTRQWKRIDTYGGKLCENATQAVARDVMKSAQLRVNRLKGVKLLGPIHDELLMELDSPKLETKVAVAMTQVPLWCPTLPVDADGYVGKRFKK